MRTQNDHMTNTTIISSPEQRASGAKSSLVHHGPPSRLAQVGYFLRHFLEMCVAMCVGGGLLNALIFVAAPALLGYPDPRQQLPELSLLVIAFIYSLPMALWMRFRGMEWRPILEMSGVAIGLAILLIGLTWLGIIPQSSLRGWQLGFCGPACVLMLIPMLLRLDLYTGRTGHHAHAA